MKLRLLKRMLQQNEECDRNFARVLDYDPDNIDKAMITRYKARAEAWQEARRLINLQEND